MLQKHIKKGNFSPFFIFIYKIIKAIDKISL